MTNTNDSDRASTEDVRAFIRDETANMPRAMASAFEDAAWELVHNLEETSALNVAIAKREIARRAEQFDQEYI